MALFNFSEHRKPGFKLALFSCFVAIIVVVLGAFTRLADAGLGYPDWPGCYGHVMWPKTETHVEAANMAFPDAPVEHDKTWLEMVHRYFASGLGLLCIGLLVVSYRNREKEQPIKLPVFLLAFIILQGMFGMWTVTLKLWPQVVTLHLLGGFATLSLLWLLTLRLNNKVWLMKAADAGRLASLRSWGVAGLLIVSMQIALGGWTTSNYAAVACPDLPTCQAQWLPEMNFSDGFNLTQEIGPNYLGGVMDNNARIAIHFSHRIGAIATALFLIALSVKMLKTVSQPQIRRMAAVVLSVLALQLALGLANILFKFPLTVAVAHNLAGALLLLCMVTLNHRIFTVKPDSSRAT